MPPKKRKAEPEDIPTSASKRQKLLPGEDPESTTELGLELIEAFKNAKDRHGRSITALFLTLPNKRDLPEYYETIKLPIALDTVENRLRKHGYPNLTAVESDLKRMVSNAKVYNDDQSLVYTDAERVRKQLCAWMKENNPAYRDPDYSPFPTPLPTGGDITNGANNVTVEEDVQESDERPKRPTITLSRGPKTSQLAEPVAPEPAIESGEFAGKSFNQVQEQIVQELIDYVDEEYVCGPPLPRSELDWNSSDTRAEIMPSLIRSEIFLRVH